MEQNGDHGIHAFGQLIFDKDAKNTQQSQLMVLENMNNHMQKNDIISHHT
jgi:hypothetical protein